MGINSGFVQGTLSGNVKGDFTARTGGLVGHNKSTGTVPGIASGNVSGNEVLSAGGLVGAVDTTAAPTVHGYWDKASTEQDASVGCGVGISSIANVQFLGGKYYDGTGTTEVFNNTEFLKHFNLPGGPGKWPTLKPPSTN